jgi:hypothetical protein
VFKNNLRFAILDQLANPPHGFQDVVQAHFYIRRHSLIKVFLIQTKGTLLPPDISLFFHIDKSTMTK